MPPTLAEAKALARAGRNGEAVAMIVQLATAGDPEAIYLFAEMRWRGGLVERDIFAARILYEQAGARGQMRAHVNATNLMASGIAGPRDWSGALLRLEQEARSDPVRRGVLELIRAMDLDADGNPAALPEPEQLSNRPDVRIYRAVLTSGECAHVINIARPGYQPSLVYDASGQLVKDTIRTSDGSAIHWLIEDPAVHALNRRIAGLTGSAYETGETLQSLRYSPGQEYRPHFDFVAGDNRRLWTALIYLNDDYDGGETTFVRTGLKVRGQRGDVLVFGNAGPDGAQDPLAEHAGLPVTRGTKYLATRWIREHRFIP